MIRVRINWRGVVNLAVSAAGWAAAAFVTTWSEQGLALPAKHALAIAAAAAGASIVQHVRQSPQLWRDLVDVGH